jgi:hypothetical protein
MALDLTIEINASGGAGARAELDKTEQSIKKVESANQRSVSWWQKEEAAIDEVTGTLTTHRSELSKVEQAAVKLESSVANAATTTSKLGTMSESATAALSGMSGGAQGTATALLELVGASEMSIAALASLTAGIGAVLGAGILWAGFLAKSSVYYEEHAAAAKGLRDELGRVEQAWNDIQFVVGASVMDGANAPLIAMLKMGVTWAEEFGVKIASDILLAKEFANIMTFGGITRNANGLADTDPGDLPDPTKVLGGKHPLGSNFTFGFRPGVLNPLPGSAAEADFNRQEADRRRQELAAAREAARLAEEIQRVHDRYIEALRRRADAEFQIRVASEQAANFAAFGNYASRLPIAQGFGVYGLNPKTYAFPSTDWFNEGKPRNDFLGATGLDPKKLGKISPFFNPGGKDLSFLSRLFGDGGITSSLGGVLQSLFVQRGDAGSAIGGSLGGSLFTTLMGGGTGKTISGALSGLLGKTLGKAVGSFIPFGGEILGSLLGKLMGPTQYQKDARQANSDISGLWAALSKQYGGAGRADSALTMFGFNPADLKGKNYQGAMGLDPLKKVFDELAVKQAKFNGDLGSTLSKIQELGGGISPALQPYLDKLTDAKVLTQENLDLLTKMAGDAVPTWQQMEAVAQKYGLTIDQLGPNFQNQKLSASFQELIDDMDLLVRGGADVGAMLTQMGTTGKLELTGVGDKVQELVLQSLKFGIDIPENMRPWIQKLIDAGLLLGATGEKITDINELKFGESMQTTLEKLNDTLKALIDSLNNGLPSAVTRASQRWRDEFGNLPMPGGGGRGGGGGGGGGGTGGGDAPPPPSATPRYGTVVIQMNGKTLAEGVVPFIPGVVTRAGLTR